MTGLTVRWMSADLHTEKQWFDFLHFLFDFPLKKNSWTTKNDIIPMLLAMLFRSELHLVCHQHWQHWPEWRVESRRGILSVPPPQGVHAGHRQPVERVGSGRQQPPKRDQHRYFCGARLHPQSGRNPRPLTCSTSQHLCWWETIQRYLFLW